MMLDAELLILPYRNGIKLIKPYTDSPFKSVENVFSMPIMSYFVSDDLFIDGNHIARNICIPGNQGYYSDFDLKNRKYNALFNEQTTQKYKENNAEIVCNDKMIIFDEVTNRLDGFHFEVVSFNFPVYNASNELIAIFGMSPLYDNSVDSATDNFIDALNKIINLGIIQSHTILASKLLPGICIAGIYLSRREVQCLQLLIAGKTSQLIGQLLHLSPRTIEHYLVNIKNKLNVRTKAELIEKVLQEIWPDMLSE